MYVTEIKETQIFKRIRWQLRIFESVFYKSLIRACSFGNSLAASQNARSNGQTSNHRHCEFVKNALKKCSCLPPWFFQIFVFLLFLSHTPEVYSNHYGVCMFYCIGIYNKHSVYHYINWKSITFNMRPSAWIFLFYDWKSSGI